MSDPLEDKATTCGGKSDLNKDEQRADLGRRTFVTGAVSAAGLALVGNFGLTGGLASASTHRKAAPPAKVVNHAIPEAAFVRKLGAVVAGACPSVGDQQCRTGKAISMYRQFGAGPSVPGLGLPLGGIGGGSFMLNQCGTFGPWNMGGQPTTESWEQRTLTQAAFRVREEIAGTRALIKTLAVPHSSIAPDRRLGTVLPAWYTLQPGMAPTLCSSLSHG